MLSKSFVRREEPPSFLLFPPEGRSLHFFKKGKERKDGSIGISHHGGRRFLSMEARKRKSKKRKSRGLRSSGRFFPLAKRGTLQMRNPEEKKREAFSSA